jgi:hypothetical protein
MLANVMFMISLNKWKKTNAKSQTHSLYWHGFLLYERVNLQN